jgi:hypothetical protein
VLPAVPKAELLVQLEGQLEVQFAVEIISLRFSTATGTANARALS